MAEPIKVSIIVPVQGAAKTLEVALASIARSTYPHTELVTTLDGAQPGVREHLEGAGAVVVEIERSGPAAARNRAIARATGDLLYFTDADVEIQPDTIERGVAHFRDDPALAALFGSYTAHAGVPGFFTAYKNYVHHFTHQTAGRNAFTFWTGCGFVRRSVFDALDGFDEAQRFLSDVEFGTRMHLAGERVRIDPTIQVTHHKAYDLAGLVRSDFFGRAIPWSRLMMRHRTVRADMNLKLENVLSVPLSIAILLSPLAAIWLGPAALAATVLGFVALAILNRGLLGFVAGERGVWFAVGTLLTQWLIYLVSAIGVTAATLGARSGGR